MGKEQRSVKEKKKPKQDKNAKAAKEADRLCRVQADQQAKIDDRTLLQTSHFETRRVHPARPIQEHAP